MTSLASIGIGIALLAISLLVRNDDIIAAPASWLGAIFVIVGTGRLFFLDNS
jgi:hypothetical protein